MVLKYKNKIYSSNDLPIFLFFKNTENKREFINRLANYNEFNVFERFTSIDVALAGNAVIKDKRSSMFISFEDISEKRALQRHIFGTCEDSNAIISTPPDIGPRVLEMWIEKNAIHLI